MGVVPPPDGLTRCGDTAPGAAGGAGESTRRPDGVLKVTGDFAYASDLRHEDMLWGRTLRSPHAHAEIRSLDTAEALALPGVHAVLTHADLPAATHYGLEFTDQPVLADDRVRHQGEPVALVAADHPETARRAAALVRVVYEPLPVVHDEATATAPDAPVLHPDRDDHHAAHVPHPNVVYRQPVLAGDPTHAVAAVVVRGDYTVGTRDQAFLGPESGLAVPAGDGGVDLHVATQRLHADQRQLAPVLGLEPERVRLTLGGVGGAFGAREDLSTQAHACLLALHTGRPVKMVYDRHESFLGHVHRHPATLSYEHGATLDGRLVYVKGRIVLDSGAYASSSPAVVGNAASLGVGPYRVPHVAMEALALYTNNPPCGAMRGLGAVQACFAYEAQMDRLAVALNMDPVELRRRNALTQGDTMPTGQRVDAPAPVAELLRLVRDRPLPPPRPWETGDGVDPRALPGGLANSSVGEGIVRGVGYGVGIENVGFAEGFDDHSTAGVRLAGDRMRRGEPGPWRGNEAAWNAPGLRLVGGEVVTPRGEVLASLAEVLGEEAVERELEFRHRPAEPFDRATGQGFGHVQYSFCAHRAVVDVDIELGLVRVVELAAAQDVGRAINPRAARGQIHGGSAQGLGLAVLEEILVGPDGLVRDPSFTDYLIPTILDVPPMPLDILELAEAHAPYGRCGAGEAPTLSATPAIVAAIRQATRLPLTRVPVRPEHLTGT
ncbi:xanthine dehydrogenase family protein molybdopterin-binding subunit [Streptomyces sedi]|uniref:Xanthine dehydrogenase subunit D n=1 Tax=Streptomyces sedi TaxID=555059 RepID=A0A5C4V7K8_9ACTN|nr:molybdopterin cofactor-binding domain-containing protein [Streptomyces sedi]TNM31635.1 xanthine dehydrogenase subunit D [Streptomyces sedi]